MNNNQIQFLNLKDINKQYSDDLKREAIKVIESGWYLLGENNIKFEKELAEYIGTKNIIFFKK